MLNLSSKASAKEESKSNNVQPILVSNRMVSSNLRNDPDTGRWMGTRRVRVREECEDLEEAFMIALLEAGCQRSMSST